MAETARRGGRGGRYSALGGDRGRGDGRRGHQRGGARGGATRGVGAAAESDRDWRRRGPPPSPSPSPSPTPTPTPVRSALLASSAPVVGELTAMCSRDEVRARQEIKDVSRFEKSPADDSDASPSWAVKKYRRPAAGRVDIDVTQLRPPRVLEPTLRHLFTNVLPWRRCGFDWSSDGIDGVGTRPQDFLALYHFLNDRLRSVRQDFVVQRVRARSRVVALVRIARFYVAASFRAAQLLGLGDKTLDWSELLNDQQLASALTEVHAQRASASSDEETSEDRALYEEATAYHVILHLRDARAVSLLLLKVPPLLLRSDAMRLVLALFVAFHTGDSGAFFRSFRALPVLQQCLALRHLPVVWVSAAHRMNKAYGKIDRFALSELAQLMDLPSAADARELCSAMNIHTEDDAAPTGAINATVESWEESAGSGPLPTQIDAPVGFVRFKINGIREDLEEAAARRLVRSKADFIQRELVRRSTATELVMEG